MSKRSKKKRALPPLLVRLIQAAKEAKEDAGGVDLSPVPGALKEFGALAQWGVPAHGAFVANEPDVTLAIGRAARIRFGGLNAKLEFEEAMRVVEDAGKKDAIETTVGMLRAADTDAYFYAGMAWGVTLAYMPGGR